MTDNSDPDRVGTFVRWRIAFYAAGDVTALHNLMYLLDGWWTYSFKDKPQRENVHLHPHINVDIDATWDNLEYQACLFSLSPLRSSLSGCHPSAISWGGAKAYTLEERSSGKLPLGIFECQPPQGKRLVLITAQVEGDNSLSFLFHGGTWLFRDAFEAAQVAGYKDETSNVYYRVVPNMDAASDDEQQRLLNVLGDGVLKNVAARVTVDGRAPVGTPAHAFLKTLRERPHLFFA